MGRANTAGADPDRRSDEKRALEDQIAATLTRLQVAGTSAPMLTLAPDALEELAEAALLHKSGDVQTSPFPGQT